MLIEWLAKLKDEPIIEEEIEPTTEESVRYIEWLMIWYCRKPSVLLANIIVERLESLRTQVEQGEVLDPEWSCQRLLQNWEYIAERARARVLR